MPRPPRSLWSRRRTLLIRLLLLGVVASAPVDAAIITLGQDAVSAAVVRRLFTDKGRRVLAGDVSSCNYAYVEQPAVAFRGGRIVLRLRFAGRAGLSSNGRCMGASDAFPATVSGQPVIEGDTISMRDVRMEEGKQEYRALLEPLLRRQLPALIGSNLRGEFTRHLESSIQDFRMAVREFRLQDVTASDGVLTVRFDFALNALPR
jgi:hypothetical protein